MDRPEDVQKSANTEDHKTTDNLRCASFSWQESDIAGGQKWGPWTSEKSSHDGFTATKTKDETHDLTSYFLSTPNGKEYFFPDGKKQVIDQKEKGPDGFLRNVKKGSPEDIEVKAALNTFSFDKLPSCQIQGHTVAAGESLWSIAKDSVIKAEVADGTVDMIVRRMARENHLKDPDTILDGQKLKIPAPFSLEDKHGKPKV